MARGNRSLQGGLYGRAWSKTVAFHAGLVFDRCADTRRQAMVIRGGDPRHEGGLRRARGTGNPAAMTRLDRPPMEGGILGIYPDSQFDVRDATFLSPMQAGYTVNANAVASLTHSDQCPILPT